MKQRDQAETGEVIHLLPGNKAKVRIPRGPSCSSCSHRDLCRPFGQAHMALEVDNSLGARRGQVVLVSFTPKKNLKDFPYLCLPLLASFLLGAILGYKLALFGSQPLSSAALSLILLVLTFTATRFYSYKKNAAQSKRQPRISKIVD